MLFDMTGSERTTVRTQKAGRVVKSMDDINASLGKLFNDQDEFVVLTLGKKEIKHGVQYIQSAWNGKSLTLQAGVIENGKIRLVEKSISPFECEGIYKKFFETSEVDDLENFTEVKF